MSPAEDVGEDEGGNDGGVGFDDEAGGVFPEFAPGDFFVGDCSGIGAVTGGGIADLAEIGPQRYVRALQILMQHGNDADREVAGDSAADLEKTERRFGG